MKSTHLVPIFVEGQWWGAVGLDDCREAKRRGSAELSALKIAADCIGSAIQRERTQQALLQAEQRRAAELVKANDALQQRDRLLETSAIATNALLTITHFDQAVNTALQIIGEALETDRVAVIENFDVPCERLPYWRVLYEWDAPHTPSQRLHPAAMQGRHEDMEELYKQVYSGAKR